MTAPQRQMCSPPIRVVVPYYGRFGVLRQVAERVAEGARTAVPDVEVECLEIEDSPIQQLRDKVGAACTASTTPHGGNEQALQSILTLFMNLGMLVVTPGQSEPILENLATPYGATAVTGAPTDHAPTEMEQSSPAFDSRAQRSVHSTT